MSQKVHRTRRQHAPGDEAGGEYRQRHYQEQAGTLALAARPPPPPFCHRVKPRPANRQIPHVLNEFDLCGGILPHHDEK
jgi:hypothetical protein